MRRPVRLTKKQKMTMGLILKKAGEGEFLTVTELHKAMPDEYEGKFGSFRKLLDILERAEMIERHPTLIRNTKQVRPTLKGYDWFRPTRE